MGFGDSQGGDKDAMTTQQKSEFEIESSTSP
jgi:hypothetical protein